MAFLLISMLLILQHLDVNAVYGKSSEKDNANNLVINDPELKAEIVVSGLDFPTSMAFIAKDDFLILEKDTGLVKRVIEGKVTEPLLALDVSSKDERGLLGIAVGEKKALDNNDAISQDVFLSYITCVTKENCDFRVDKYNLDIQNNRLVNPQELLSIKSFPDPAHQGGIIDIGPDNNLYVTVGNFQSTIPSEVYKTLAQNYEDGGMPDGRGGILRISPEGNAVDGGILGEEYPLNLYYAYGIRNSFGLDFDPVSGYLWDTENGPDYGDEINLVEAGFNSGSTKLFGIIAPDSNNDLESIAQIENQNSLLTFNGKGKYSDPKFTWESTIAPTALQFLNSDRLGKQYQNDLFIGTADAGKIYHFDLNDNRNELFLEGLLQDKIAAKNEEEAITFGEGFGVITDIEASPYDGYLYVVSPAGDASGTVYKISPTNDNVGDERSFQTFQESNDNVGDERSFQTFQESNDNVGDERFFQTFQESNDNVGDERNNIASKEVDNDSKLTLDELFDFHR